MDPQFWLEKWNRQEIGFNQAEAHAMLQSLYAKVFASSDGIFVPLCGKSVDLSFLAAQGSYTLGNELSEKAVLDFFSENDLVAEESLLGSLKLFKSSGLDILQGDFFKVQPEHVSQCQAIYDRAALIALPPAMRNKYVSHLRALFTRAKMLLITLQYPQEQMSGPPFSVDLQEVEQLFSFAKVERLVSNNILAQEPHFAARGLQTLFECAYRIEWSD